LKIGISHHLVGADVSRLLAGLAREDPDLVVSLTVDGSQGLMTRYDDVELDAVFLLRHKTTRRFGETIGTVRFQWFGVAALTENADQAIPLVSYPAGCNMRAMTIEVLEDAGIAWREAFIGVSAANL
ncbi:LysR substrate-binding domain-containing protein, partial [Bacillus subtilis]